MRVFENSVLRKPYCPKRDDVKGNWRRLHNDDLYNLYYSPNIIRVITSRIIGWAGHVARMEHRRDAYGILMGDLRKRDHLEVLVCSGSG